DSGPGRAMWALWSRHVAGRLLDRLYDGGAAPAPRPHSPVVRQAGEPPVPAARDEGLTGVAGMSAAPGVPTLSGQPDRSDDEKASSC
ncbi:ATP-grasp domain-containing protein, partial [Streptomyces hyaluromycini]